MNQKFTLVVSSVTVAAVLAVGCGKGSGGGASSGDRLAVVNNQPITMKDFYSYLQEKPTVQVLQNNIATDLPVASTLGFQGLKDLVLEKLIEQIAIDDGVRPTDADVEAEIKFETTRDPQMVQQNLARGIGIDQIRHTIFIDLCKYNIVTKGITVTSADVDQYRKDNPAEFKNPPSADLLWIYVLSAADRDKVDKELKGGGNFASIAMRYSQDPNARQYQGRYSKSVMLPGLAASLPNDVIAAVKKTSEHTSTDWIPGNPGYAKFYINKVTPMSDMVVTDTILTLIKRRIASDRGQRAVDLPKRVNDKLKTAVVDVNYKPLKDMWDTAASDLKLKNATGSSTAPGQGTVTGTTASTAGGDASKAGGTTGK